MNGTATSITQLNRLNVIQDGGKKLPLTFSDAEFDRRLVALRGTMETENPATSFLEPGMVVSMEPMITIPDGQPGACGYREHDMLIVGDDGAENITGYPLGPDHNVLPC